METTWAILIGSAFATCGWIYSARRARTLSRKQHTVTVMLQASLNKEFREALLSISDAITAGKCPDLSNNDHKNLRIAMRFVSNHYEFISAGLRNGDFDERLIRDSERGVIIKIYSFFEGHIYSLRLSRDRQTIYENLEWLNVRWTKNPPGVIQQTIEWIVQQPFGGKRVNPHA
jgi:hypothetical protein